MAPAGRARRHRRGDAAPAERSPGRALRTSFSTTPRSSAAARRAGRHRPFLRRPHRAAVARAGPGRRGSRHRSGAIKGAYLLRPRSGSPRSRCAGRPTGTRPCRSPLSSSATASGTRCPRRSPLSCSTAGQSVTRQAAIRGRAGELHTRSRQGRHAQQDRGPLLLIAGQGTTPSPRWSRPTAHHKSPR